MSDIVERLRKQAWQRSGAPKMDAGHAKMLEWLAADELERLRGELEDAKLIIGRGMIEAAKLRGQVERLTAAVQFVIDGYPRGDVNHQDYRVEVYKVALDALSFVAPHDEWKDAE